MPRRQRGFSLMELLAVAVILAVLAATIVPRLTMSSATAREGVHEYNKNQINSAVERYTVEQGDQPTSIDDLDTPSYFPEGLPTNPVDGQPYALDPVTKRVVD